MLVKLWHKAHPVSLDHPGGLVAVFMIFEPIIDGNPCHSYIYAGFQRIALRVEPQNRTMRGHSVVQQNHVNVVVKVTPLLTNWYFSFQFAGQQRWTDPRSITILCKEHAVREQAILFMTYVRN